MKPRVRLALAVTVVVTATMAGMPPPAAAAKPAAVLRIGSHGADVRAVQERLGLPADGDFGRRTAGAVKRFQRRQGLPVTGRVDAATRKALRLAPKAKPLGTGGAVAQEEDEPPLVTAPLPVQQVPIPAGGVERMLAAARATLGRPYAKGGDTPAEGFDCSGLVQWAGAQAGMDLPRSSFAQYGLGTPVHPFAVRPGDLVFFDTAGPGASDVGIAISPTRVVSATTHGVREHDLGGSYWGAHFVGARRLA